MSDETFARTRKLMKARTYHGRQKRFIGVTIFHLLMIAIFQSIGWALVSDSFGGYLLIGISVLHVIDWLLIEPKRKDIFARHSSDLLGNEEVEARFIGWKLVPAFLVLALLGESWVAAASAVIYLFLQKWLSAFESKTEAMAIVDVCLFAICNCETEIQISHVVGSYVSKRYGLESGEACQRDALAVFSKEHPNWSDFLALLKNCFEYLNIGHYSYNISAMGTQVCIEYHPKFRRSIAALGAMKYRDASELFNENSATEE